MKRIIGSWNMLLWSTLYYYRYHFSASGKYRQRSSDVWEVGTGAASQRNGTVDRNTSFRSFRWIFQSSRPNGKPEKEMRIQWSGIPGIFSCWFPNRTTLSFGNFGGGDSEEDLWHFARQGEHWNGDCCVWLPSKIHENPWKSIRLWFSGRILPSFGLLSSTWNYMEVKTDANVRSRKTMKLGCIFSIFLPCLSLDPRIPTRSDLWAYESQQKTLVSSWNIRRIDCARGFVPDAESSRKPTLSQRCW